MQNKVFIADFLRVPTGKKNGYYRKIIPEILVSEILKQLQIRNTFLKDSLNQLILGCSLGTGGNMARYALLEAGFSTKIPCVTIDSQCISSYSAIETGFSLIKSGRMDVVIVGGLESNSLAPERIYNKNDFRNNGKAYKYSTFAPISKNGDKTLIELAGTTSIAYNLSRDELINWAINSNKKAEIASKQGYLEKNIYPFLGNHIDETIKKIDVLERFKNKHQDNLVDASTSCQYDDGAALIVLVSTTFKEKLQLKDCIELKDIKTVGVDISNTVMAFKYAIENLLSDLKLSMNKIDLFEINESFALKPVLFSKLLNIPTDKINILGGNLAFGHPFGASGAINLGHLTSAMKLKKAKFGIVAASAAGGLGSAVLLENHNI